MAFKSPNQRKFAFANMADKQKGQNFTSNPTPAANSGIKINSPVPQIKAPVIAVEPKLPKQPRFAKIRNYLK